MRRSSCGSELLGCATTRMVKTRPSCSIEKLIPSLRTGRTLLVQDTPKTLCFNRILLIAACDCETGTGVSSYATPAYLVSFTLRGGPDRASWGVPKRLPVSARHQ